MEDTVETQAQVPALSPEDMQRVNGCEFYLRTKEIIASCEEYRPLEVGSAVHIVRKSDDKIISTDYEGKFPEKFIIVHNDNGFVFVKRVNANGKPGVAITCLTIDYPANSYYIKADDSYIESVLLDTEDKYDPLADAKALAKRKTKASRENAKKRIVFDFPFEAYNYLKTLKVGDKVYHSDHSYASTYTEYVVDSIDSKPVNAQMASSRSYYYNEDADYSKLGFKDIIKVHFKVVTSTKKYSYALSINYKDLAKTDYAANNFLFKEKPISPDEIGE